MAFLIPVADALQTNNRDWWPEQVNLQPLRQHNQSSNPYGADFDYAAAFNQLDLQALKADIRKTLTTSQDWWPADYGHYGPFFVRMDASAAQTDALSFAVLEPKADAFRNYYHSDSPYAPVDALVEKARLLELSVPEMTVLLGGMRVLDANSSGVKHGVFTSKPGTLSNDFFVNLLDMSTAWSKAKTEGLYEGHDRASGKLKWTATPTDLIFGSNSELRAVAEVYASKDGGEKFVSDFINAWNKVMMSDRFDI